MSSVDVVGDRLADEQGARPLRGLPFLRVQSATHQVSQLKGSSDRWRIRVGDRRIFYKIEDGRLVVLVIAIGRRDKDG
ncbi:type II toxin-antitoxin system RelE/ParE family toxin [Glycomyces sp. L485]|uniref:type II toxin-antitoxin system RelE family toxin n=1 Tax=Glycomyces sp. L485 TaxID=2909235 RepID=UPI001F4A848C|nr:type II toxin-antitoxin system RelE/ParE family toxin [Glycomyces sp. L485]